MKGKPPYIPMSAIEDNLLLKLKKYTEINLRQINAELRKRRLL